MASIRVRSTIDFRMGLFQGYLNPVDDTMDARILWDGQEEPEVTIYWNWARTFATPIRHRDGHDLGT